MLRYLRDGCTREEAQLVDAHLANCPLCSDAMEGAMSLPMVDLERHLASLDAKIVEKYPSVLKEKTVLKPVRTRRIGRWLMAAAASIALFLAGGFWLILRPPPNLNNADVASEKTASPNATSAEVPPQYESPKTDADVAGVLENGKLLPKNDKNTNKNVVNDAETSVASSGKISVQTEPSAIVKPSPTSDNGFGSSQNVPSPVTAETQNESNSAMKKDEVADQYSAKRKEKARNDDVAVTQDATRNYGGAANQNAPAQSQMQEVVVQGAAKKRSADNGLKKDTETFQRAMILYKNKDFAKAIGEFNRVLANQKTGDVYENTLWYLANSYIQTNDKTAAQALLDRIVKENGLFKSQAEALISKRY